MRLQHATILIFVLISTICSARTWRVEQDGSGEYLNIQDAVDVAAPRDTILVGPGRYDQYWVIHPEIHWETVVGVPMDSLTIIGTDRNAVIIGGSVPYPLLRADKSDKRISSHGIVAGENNNWLIVENISFENMDVGVKCLPGGIVRDCLFQHVWDTGARSDNSLLATPAYTFLVEDCEMKLSRNAHAVTVRYFGGATTTAVVRRLRVHTPDLDYAAGVGVYSDHPNLTVEDCHFEYARVGYQIDYGHALISSCLVDHSLAGIVVDSPVAGSIAEFHDVSISNSSESDAWIKGTMIAESCMFSGHGSIGSIVANITGVVSVHQSHILNNGAPYSTYIPFHNGPPDALDLTNNWWGVADADSIAALIHDGNDDPTVQTFVEFEPFLTQPVGNEKKSMGDLRRMFR